MGRVSALSEQVSKLQGTVHQKAERAALQEQESCVRELGDAVQQQAEELAAAVRSATCRGEEQAEALERLAEDLAAVARGGQCAHPELACAAVLTPASSVRASQPACKPTPAPECSDHL